MHLTKLINMTKKARLKTIRKTYYHKKAFKYYQLITNYNLLMQNSVNTARYCNTIVFYKNTLHF